MAPDRDGIFADYRPPFISTFLTKQLRASLDTAEFTADLIMERMYTFVLQC
ncbi:hypothetical protein MANES_08G172650v8 [Manihot esculenta]|uniref:Uncharacterized protein n=1 Tax=Manihot esculenta TaxID=3983 RepID=A0ACB7HD21_MANES|nr:hypothetical protein MANES_08G172650v8 [Manihot esculenta]